MRQLKISYNVTMRNSVSLEKYLKDVNREPMLTDDQEKMLALKARNGDEHALEDLVKGNLRFVIAVAKQFQNQGVPLIDLINEGNIGLLKAARRFDETKGFKFISYAVWWIRQSIQQCIYDYSKTIRIPKNKITLYQKISKYVIQYEQEFNVLPSNDEICKALEISLDDFEEYLIFNNPTLPLDQSINEDTNKSFVDITKNNNEVAVDSNMIQQQDKQSLLNLVNKLSTKEADIIKRYYGLDEFNAMSLEDIGESIGLTRERVRQIKEEGLKKLRVYALKNYD